MKFKNGKLETVGNCYAEVDPQVWKQLQEEEG
jgi:hypothetical protein